MGHKERNGGGRTGCNLNPRAWGGGGCLRGDTEHTLIWRSAPQDNMWDPQLPGPRSAAEAGPWARVGRVVSGLRHVSLCCWVGRGPGSPACAGWGRAGLCGAAPMRKSSCALPRGFAAVAKNQGEGNKRLDPAQPHFGVGAACHPGTLLPRAA